MNLSCWVLRIWEFWDVMFCYCSGISIYLYFSLVVSYSHSHSLFLFLSPFIAFVVDIILTVIVEYFWDLHCLAIMCCFWYLQLCLFYFCLSGTTILTVFLLAIALFVCIVCHYCLSGTTILTLINHGIFVFVFALIVCIMSRFSRSGQWRSQEFIFGGAIYKFFYFFYFCVWNVK